MNSSNNFVVIPQLLDLLKEAEQFFCQFCSLSFSSHDEYKAHTFSHFNEKSCSECNVRLVQICDDWFEIHTAFNCQNKISHIHSFRGPNIDDDAIDNVMNIKEEPIDEVETAQINELFNVKTDADLDEFGQIFAVNLSNNLETHENNDNYNTTISTPEIQEQSKTIKKISLPPLRYRVVNINVIDNDETETSNNIALPLKKNSQRITGFQCRFCDNVLGSRFALNNHIQSHHVVDNARKCNHCNRKFSTFKKLDKHLRYCAFNTRKRQLYKRSHPHRPTTNFTCDICGSILKRFQTLQDHMNEKHSSKNRILCRICGRCYPSRWYLRKHLDRHKQAFEITNQTEDIIVSDVDKNLMKRRKYVRAHPHRPHDNFTCDICGKNVNRFDLLEEHMSRNHSAADSFQCRMCLRTYPNRYYLQKHLIRHKNYNFQFTKDFDTGLMERKKYEKRDPNHQTEAITCNECGQVFKHDYLLREHKSSRHSAISSFQCRKCDRLYPNRYYLTKHIKRHEELERKGLTMEQLAEDIDDGLMERNKYVRAEKDQKSKTSYDCDECDRTFTKFCYLTEHKRARHAYENGFQCVKCGRCFPNRHYLTKHNRKRHGNTMNLIVTDDSSESEPESRPEVIERKPYIVIRPQQTRSQFNCELCGMEYQIYDQLIEHINSNHPSQTTHDYSDYFNRCDVENQLEHNTETTANEQQNESLVESGKNPFMCRICSRTYTNRYYLQKHMKRHSEANNGDQQNVDLDENLVKRKFYRVHPHRPKSNLQCDICKKVLSSFYSLEDHMKSKHSEKSQDKQTCTICNKMFASKKNFAQHQKLKHSKKDDVDATVLTKPKYPKNNMCSICGRLFPDRSKMLQHEKTHSGVLIPCELCDKKFLYKYYLRKHMQGVHSNVRPFACKIDGCTWTFSYQQCFQRHQARRHGMVRNLNTCPICGKNFPDSTYHLKRHLKAHANNTAKEYIPEPKQDSSSKPTN